MEGGPDCIKWKDKILYHSGEIEEWFETQNLDPDNTDPEPEENSKPESESMPEPETEIESDTEMEVDPDDKADSNEDEDSSDMPEPAKEPEYEYLKPQDVSERFNISKKTLANWRCQGKGPGYFKLGNKIRYPIEKLKKWFGDQETELETEPIKVSEPDTNFQPKKKAKSCMGIEPDTKPTYLDECMSPSEVGEKYRLKTQTLASWRSLGRGPKYQKFGNKVYFHIDRIDKWIATSRVRIY